MRLTVVSVCMREEDEEQAIVLGKAIETLCNRSDIIAAVEISSINVPDHYINAEGGSQN